MLTFRTDLFLVTSVGGPLIGVAGAFDVGVFDTTFDAGSGGTGTESTWVDVTADLHRPSGLVWRRGMTGNTPTDLVASTGTYEFALVNVDGRYSPGGPQVQSGFTFGVPVRVTAIQDDATETVVWRGRLRTIDPVAGIYGPRLTHCSAQDIIGELAEADLREVPPQVDHSEVDLLTVLLAQLPPSIQLTVDFDAALDIYPYAFDDLAGGTKALDGAVRVIASAQGLLFGSGDGTLHYLNRETLMTQSTVAVFTDAELAAPDGFHGASTLANVYNLVRVTVHPRTVSPTVVVLAATSELVEVLSGVTLTVWADYTDPINREQVIGGANFQPFTAGVDYRATTAGGANLLGTVSITVEPFAASAKFTIINGGGVTAYVFYQIRGSAIYDRTPVTQESRATADYGVRPLDIDLPYQSSALIAKDRADYLLNQFQTVANQGTDLTYAATTADLADRAVTLDIGDVIAVTETQTGLSVTAMILAVEATVDAVGVSRWTYRLGPAFVGTVFTLDSDLMGLLDNETALLGYG
jgi:hypothetical protein